MRVGLLLANSTFIDRLAGDIRRAVDLGLRHGGVSDARLIVETTGYNERVEDVRAGLQDLLIKQDCDAVVLPLNPSLAAEVADLAEGQQVPVILLSMGEDVCLGTIAPPWVFTLDFGIWASAWLLGYHAVETTGQNIALMSAPHAGGYGLPFAVALGIEQAGGQIQRVLPIVPGMAASDLEPVVQGLAEDAPDAVILLAAPGEGDVPLSVFEVEAPDVTVLQLAPLRFGSASAANGAATPTVTGWNPVSDGAVRFAEIFAQETGRIAHPHAVMGYEAGLALATAKAASGPGGMALRNALASASPCGPRGPVTFDPETQHSIAPQVLVEFATGDLPVVVRTRTMSPPSRLLEDRTQAQQTMQKQGWLNPYLIA